MTDAGGSSGTTVAPSYADRLGTWLFAVVAVIVTPLLPILIEAARNNLVIKAENLLLTAAVLAAGFAFSSLSNIFRACYGLLFIISISLNFHPEQNEALNTATHTADAVKSVNETNWLFGHPGYFVISVCLVHAIERLYWHIGKHKKFPDWLNEGGKL